MNYNERMINRKPFDGLKKVDGGWMRAKQFYPDYVKVMWLDGSGWFVILKFMGWHPNTYTLHYGRPGLERSDMKSYDSWPRFYPGKGLRFKYVSWNENELVPATEEEYKKDLKNLKWRAGDYRRASFFHGGTWEKY